MDTGLDGSLPGFPFCSGSRTRLPINPKETWAGFPFLHRCTKGFNDNIPRHSIHLFNVGNDDNDQEDRSVEWPSRRNQVRHPQGRQRCPCTTFVRSLVVDTQSYHLCLPILFNVRVFLFFSSFPTLMGPPIDGQSPIQRDARQLSGLCAVIVLSIHPRIDICTKSQKCGVDRVGDQSDEITESIQQILSRTNRLAQLSLCIGGSLRNTIIPVFGRLTRLHTFALANWEDEEVAPLYVWIFSLDLSLMLTTRLLHSSERLAMALTLSLPALRDLSLARVTRSALYASELLGGTVPVVHNDADVPVPAGLPELRLPSLLGLTRLRRLRIRETHLGDQLWGTIEAPSEAPELEVLDLGASPYETPAFNDQCTQRILSRAPTRFLHTFSLSTGAPPSPSSSSTSSTLPALPDRSRRAFLRHETRTCRHIQAA